MWDNGWCPTNFPEFFQLLSGCSGQVQMSSGSDSNFRLFTCIIIKKGVQVKQPEPKRAQYTARVALRPALLPVLPSEESKKLRCLAIGTKAHRFRQAPNSVSGRVMDWRDDWDHRWLMDHHYGNANYVWITCL
ncbi:uncharacterized protein LOC125537125 [Triticum urartu]|uniref:uncharacterized protein LOC125537125 n=1 Tax=Triticum urartu TaxID=4572 RepID=UPI00204349E9|nr:uncharacterized protein LOC125537125 [Triticum urartu]